MTDIEGRFALAEGFIRELPPDGPLTPSHSQKLHFYGLYKQARHGDCDTEQPGYFSLVARAKWNAWDKLRGRTKVSCMREYTEQIVDIARSLDPSDLSDDFRNMRETFLERMAPKPAPIPEEEEEEVVTREHKRKEEKEEEEEDQRFVTPKRHTTTPYAHLNGGGAAADATPRVSDIQQLQQANHKKLCDLESRLMQLLQRTISKTDVAQPVVSHDAPSAEIQPFRDELKHLLTTIEERIRRREAEFITAERQWNAQIEQVQRTQQKLLERVNASPDGIRRRQSVIRRLFAFLGTAVPLALSAYAIYIIAKRRKLI